MLFRSRICVRIPIAKILVADAGVTALIPLTRVRANALSVPRVSCEGEISLRAS